jgi:hypothetical protein
MFTPKKVQKIFKRRHRHAATTQHAPDGRRGDKRRKNDKYCAVYEVHDVVNQQVFTDLLWVRRLPEGSRPMRTSTWSRVHPVLRAHLQRGRKHRRVARRENIFPPSDVELIKPMAVDYNRGREGLRVHRIANRPATVSARGVLDDQDATKLATHADFENIELKISKSDDINKLIQPKPTVKIQPELYDVEHVFVDTQRVVGDQAANLGGTSGSTATETTIAENSRTTNIQSNIDDLDEFLTELMRAGGQVLLEEMDEQTVKKIAGPGAVWPQLSAKEIQEEVCLQITAGSSGRPNKGARLQAVEKTLPLLLQVPGIKPRKIADFVLREIDEGIEVDEFLDDALPSITAMNNMAKPNLSPQPGGPAQASAGASNVQQPAESGAKTQNLNPSGVPHPKPPPLVAVQPGG